MTRTTTIQRFAIVVTLTIAAPAFADVAADRDHAEDKAQEEKKGDESWKTAKGDHRVVAKMVDGKWVRVNEPVENEAEEGITNWWSWDYGEGAKEESHKHLPPPFGWALVNFLIFAGILSKILWAPLKRGWITRHELIKGELSEARRLREAAEAQLAEYTKKVQNADREVDELLASLRKEAENDRARIVAAAEAEAKRLKAEADRQIKIEIERARDLLRATAVAAAVAAAEDIVRKNVNADDQKRLAERYVADIDQAKKTSGGVA